LTVAILTLSGKRLIETDLLKTGFLFEFSSFPCFSLTRIHHLECGLAASPSLLQKHAVNERRLEEVKNGQRLLNWTTG
jgi:hypothetical protein